MSSVYTKEFLTGTENGTGLKVSATAAGSAVTVHTVPSDAKDEVWLYATNNDGSSNVTVTVLFGGTDDPDDYIYKTIAPQRGLSTIIPGFPLNESLVVKAFASSANKVSLHGFVNRISSGSSGGSIGG